MRSDELTDEQASWLRRVLESRPKKGLFDRFTIPSDVHRVLIEKGLIRSHRGLVEITLEGIRAWARRPLPESL